MNSNHLSQSLVCDSMEFNVSIDFPFRGGYNAYVKYKNLVLVKKCVVQSQKL